jgi:hypothetical protein
MATRFSRVNPDDHCAERTPAYLEFLMTNNQQPTTYFPSPFYKMKQFHPSFCGLERELLSENSGLVAARSALNDRIMSPPKRILRRATIRKRFRHNDLRPSSAARPKTKCDKPRAPEAIVVFRPPARAQNARLPMACSPITSHHFPGSAPSIAFQAVRDILKVPGAGSFRRFELRQTNRTNSVSRQDLRPVAAKDQPI